MNLQFTKMQGLGNDFAVIDGVRQQVCLTPDWVQRMANRHFGIGFDQLLLVEPSPVDAADFAYRIFNADGSEVGQCGNGARCVARFLVESGLAAADKTSFILAAKDRLLEVHCRDHNQVAINMGVPLFEPAQIPFQAPAKTLIYAIELDGAAPEITVVNLGNPHAVLQVDNVDTAPVSTIGPQLERHPRFPEGVNVGFMQCVDRQHIRLRVFERGAGETLACGSGACAAVVAGQLRGLLDPEVEVTLLGGQLTISWAGEGEPVCMVGPAETVFTGVWLQPCAGL
jgi:diaminopimelate epimerase